MLTPGDIQSLDALAKSGFAALIISLGLALWLAYRLDKQEKRQSEREARIEARMEQRETGILRELKASIDKGNEASVAQSGVMRELVETKKQTQQLVGQVSASQERQAATLERINDRLEQLDCAGGRTPRQPRPKGRLP